MNKIGFIGAGQMATALAGGISRAKPANYSIRFFDPSEPSCQRFQETVAHHAEVALMDGNQAVVAQSDIVFLAVKPHLVRVALDEVDFSSNPLLISVVAGVKFGTLEALTGSKRIIRAMPNTPCLIGKGAIGFAKSGCETGASATDVAIAKALLESVGVAAEVAPQLIDAVTGLSGSGPAFVFTFVESLIDGGVLAGLPRAEARKLALQTVAGAVAMIEDLEQHPAALRDQVTSPGGTTISGLRALENRGFRAAVMAAVTDATDRARELG